MPDAYQLIVAMLIHQHRPAGLQYPAHLPPRWRPDPALAALVSLGPRAQSDGCIVSGLFRSRRTRRCLALGDPSVWTGLIAAYAGMNCWNGFKTARALRKLEKIPRRQGFACPSCRTAPPLGPIWRCNKCDTKFDTFETGGVCPQCSARFEKPPASTAASLTQSASGRLATSPASASCQAASAK